MQEATAFLGRQGPLFLFLIVLGQQLGLPLPSVPVLLAVGALARGGRFSLALALLASLGACLAGDLAWFELGRRRGARVRPLAGGFDGWKARGYPIDKAGRTMAPDPCATG